MIGESAMNPATLDLYQRYVIPNYTRYPVCLVAGKGPPFGTMRATVTSISSLAGAATFSVTVHRALSKRCENRSAN